MAKNCRYILKPFTKNSAAIYCEGKVSFKIKLDDDMNRYREYDFLCSEHKVYEKGNKNE